MLAKSAGLYGDQVTLTSTIHSYAKPTILRFSYYIQEADESNGGSLLVYLLSVQRAPVVRLFTSESERNDDNNEWREQKLCIPTGTYYVVFLARLGLPFKSDVAIDDVQLTDTTCQVRDSDSSAGNCMHLTAKIMNSDITLEAR